MSDQYSEVFRNLEEVFNLQVSEELKCAFHRYPRELFARRIYDDRQKQWVTNNDKERWQLLTGEDRYLPIQVSESGVVTSSISQPSLVLAMIEYLHLAPGQKVLEIGAASGWSAAIMADLVGPAGKVVSVEIDEDLVSMGKANLDANRIRNVKVVHGDAFSSLPEGEMYDRIVYTVGARDFPSALLERVMDGGEIVLVHKFDDTADVLYRGVRRGDRLELDPIMPVLFVELQGAYHGSDHQIELANRVAFPAAAPFWGDVSGYVDLLYRTAGLRFFFRNATPEYRRFKQSKSPGFGLYSRSKGIAVALKGTGTVQGSRHQVAHFVRLLHHWVDLGMPGLTAFSLVISRRADGQAPAFGFQGTCLRYDYHLPGRPVSTLTAERRPKKTVSAG
jgi:protein-L-isoaspartate(D-aspartate) O-methyltransferase